MAEDVKAVEAQRAAELFSGIDALDRMLGGIPNGSVILLMGRPGSGFDIFAQQLLYGWAVKRAGSVVYVAVDHPHEDVSSEMAARGFDLTDLISGKKWMFIDGYTPRLNIRRGSAGPKVMMDFLGTLPSNLKQGVWSAVDTFSYFLQNYDAKEVLAKLDELISHVREQGGLHFLLLLEGLHDPETLTLLSHYSDGMFTFSLDPSQAEPIGILRIEKLRRRAHAVRTIPYKIVEKGLSIETAVRIA